MEKSSKFHWSFEVPFYLHSTPQGENEDLLLFVVPKTHQTAALHMDAIEYAGHQGCDHTLSILQEHFW